MGAFDGGDGRLELDELGAVIDDATTLPRAETLEDPYSTPTLGERLEAAGVLPWLRRHRVLSSVVAGAAALAAVALVVRAETAPPPIDPDITATVTDQLGAMRGGGAPGEVISATYSLSGVRRGEAVTIDGITGPGLRASTAVASQLPVGDDSPDTDVNGVLDCTDPDALTATRDDYTLRVSRTDRWGRTVSEARPLPDGGSDWAREVRTVCWSAAPGEMLALDDVVVRTDPRRGDVNVQLTITSGLPVDVRVGTESIDAGTVVVGRTFAPLLKAGGEIGLEVLLDIRSCIDVALPSFGPYYGIGYSVPGPGLMFVVSSTEGPDAATTTLALTGEQADAIQRGLDEVCAGAPESTVSLLSAGPAAQVRDNALLVPVSLRVDVDGGRAGVVSIPRDDLTSEPAVLVPDDDGVVTGTWLVYCGFPQAMRVDAEVVAGDRTYPLRWESTDERLAAQIVAGCPDVSREVLTTYGWPPAA